MLAEDPRNSFLTYALAKECEAGGDLEKATEWMEKLRQNDPVYTGLYYHLAAMYKASGDVVRCRQILEEGIRICEQQKQSHDLAELKQSLVNLDIELLEEG